MNRRRIKRKSELEAERKIRDLIARGETRICREQLLSRRHGVRNKRAAMNGATAAMQKLIIEGVLTRPQNSDAFFAPDEWEPTWWYVRSVPE